VFYQISDNLSGSQDRAGFLFFLVFFFTLLSLNSLNVCSGFVSPPSFVQLITHLSVM
jgi:hypothetical protein